MPQLTEEPFSLTVVSLGTRWSLSIAGSVDIDGGSQLIQVAGVLAERRVAAVDFDLIGVSFVDTAGWHSVQEARRMLDDAGVRTRIRGSGPAVDRLLTALDRASTTPPLGTATESSRYRTAS